MPKYINKIFSEGKRFYTLSNPEIDSILKFIFYKQKDKYDKLYSIIKLQEGTPYQGGSLGEEQKPDEDPLFRLDVTDCTIFILITEALLHSSNIEQAKKNIIIANYRPKENTKSKFQNPRFFTLPNILDSYEVSYFNRLHFTTDRLQTSPFDKDITLKVAGKEKTISKQIILNKKNSEGKRLIDINWEKKIEIRYIPNKFITKKLLKQLPKICGLAFIKEKYFEMGLDVVHEAILVEGKTLFHASSEYKKVLEVKFLDYYFKEKGKPRFDGIIIFELL